MAGCVSLPQEPGFPSAKAKPLMQMHRIKVGMSMPEVRAVLSDTLLLGYRQKNNNMAQFEPIAIPQPYRQEEFVKEGHNYVILYYNAFVVKADDLIAEDELTPLIFKDGLLLGTGLDTLDQVKRQ